MSFVGYSFPVSLSCRKLCNLMLLYKFVNGFSLCSVALFSFLIRFSCFVMFLPYVPTFILCLVSDAELKGVIYVHWFNLCFCFNKKIRLLKFVYIFLILEFRYASCYTYVNREA